MSDPHPTSLATSARSRFARGARLGLPVLLGYVPVGAAFGLAATAAGFTIAQATACSAFVLAGAGQFIALAAVKAGAGLTSALVATGVVNLRYLLFSATLSPHLRGVSRTRQALLAFTLTDETFAVNISDLREGKADSISMLGVGAVAWIGWTAGTLVGALAGSAIGDPSRWGVDFAMPAMFTALLVGQLTGRKEAVAAAVAGVLALLLTAVLPGQWPVVAASVAAATFMTVATR
jgi:4-azaleucine resistance transporter AzlC